MANIHGTSHGDSLVGTEHNDVIHGKKGDDHISHGAPRGPQSNDWLYGDDGNDYLASLNGKDYLSGGAGNDSFFALNVNDLTIVGGSGHDAVYMILDERHYKETVFEDHVEYERHDRSGADIHIELYGVEHVHFNYDF